MNNIQPQPTIPIAGYIDATTPDLTVHSPVLEAWAKTTPILFWVGTNEYMYNRVMGQLYLVERDPETREPTGELIPVDAVSK
jgi:hypothetical protein